MYLPPSGIPKYSVKEIVISTRYYLGNGKEYGLIQIAGKKQYVAI